MRYLVFVTLVLLLGTYSAIYGVGAQETAYPAADEWPLPERDPGNTSYAPVDLAPPLSLLWRQRVPPPGARLDRTERVWTVASRSRVHIAAVFRGVHSARGAYAVRTLDASTGRLRWHLDGTLGHLCLVGNTLITARALPRKDSGPQGIEVLGLDPATGRVRWTTRSRGSPPSEDVRVITSDGVRLLVGVLYDLTVMEPETGRVISTHPMGGGSETVPSWAGDLAFTDGLIATHYFTRLVVHGVTGKAVFLDGEPLSRRFALPEAPYTFQTTAIVADGYYIDRGQSPAGAVYRMSPDSVPTRLWALRGSLGPPAPYSRGHLVLAVQAWDPEKERGWVIGAHDLATGRLLWEHAPLALSGGAVGVRGWFYLPGTVNMRSTTSGLPTGRGGLYAFDAETGRLAWKYVRPRLFLKSPVVAGGRILAVGYDGCVYAFGRPPRRAGDGISK